jgi:DedD protein
MAKQISTDEESNLKRKARRRLIGAIALTTAVVVILPMVLDREPAPTAHDIELRIPDKDNAGEFTPNAALPAASTVVPDSPVAPGSAVAATSPVAPPAAIAPLLNAKPAAEAAKPKVVAPAKPKVESKPKTTAKPAEKAASTPHSGFVVQVGAFANAESAKHLQAKLAKQGLHAYTEKAGNATRVRVGSYPSHDAADKVKRKLEAQGLHPNVVNLN